MTYRPPSTSYTLVVDGVAMPLKLDERGRYARLYVFGRGANTVEVRSPDGAAAAHAQFYEAQTDKLTAKLRVVLAWDTDASDLDLHVITPDGQHAFWANPVLQGGGGLDADSVDGAGPEMFSIAAPRKGAYHVYVNYWGNFGNQGYHFDEKTRRKPVITVRVTLVYAENSLRERRESFVVPLRKIGDLILVKSAVL